jgi:sulfite reductase alpha subunit-like flavoprotein
MRRRSRTRRFPTLSLAPCALQGVHFGVFGLGNKQYEHFNAVGKRMHKNMHALGATPICARGDGDDDDNIGERGNQGAGRGLRPPWTCLQARPCTSCI